VDGLIVFPELTTAIELVGAVVLTGDCDNEAVGSSSSDVSSSDSSAPSDSSSSESSPTDSSSSDFSSADSSDSVAVDDKYDDVSGDETAWGYDTDSSVCFLDMENLNTNRWGWSNGPYAPGDYVLQLYAGAGQCDLNAGAYVGDLYITYDGAQVTAKY
jgi:hypothetical protein